MMGEPPVASIVHLCATPPSVNLNDSSRALVHVPSLPGEEAAKTWSYLLQGVVIQKGQVISKQWNGWKTEWTVLGWLLEPPCHESPEFAIIDRNTTKIHFDPNKDLADIFRDANLCSLAQSMDFNRCIPQECSLPLLRSLQAICISRWENTSQSCTGAVLMTGPEGSGKSHLVFSITQAICGLDAAIPFFVWDQTTTLQCAGNSLRYVFSQMERACEAVSAKFQPSIVLFRDVDSILATPHSPETGNLGGDETGNSILQALCRCVDILLSQRSALVICTAKYASAVPLELQRRMGQVIPMVPPTTKQREVILFDLVRSLACTMEEFCDGTRTSIPDVGSGGSSINRDLIAVTEGDITMPTDSGEADLIARTKELSVLDSSMFADDGEANTIKIQDVQESTQYASLDNSNNSALTEGFGANDYMGKRMPNWIRKVASAAHAFYPSDLRRWCSAALVHAIYRREIKQEEGAVTEKAHHDVSFPERSGLPRTDAVRLASGSGADSVWLGSDDFSAVLCDVKPCNAMADTGRNIFIRPPLKGFTPTPESVGLFGLQSVWKEIEKIVLAPLSQVACGNLAVQPVSGFLLVGPSGTGKTRLSMTLGGAAGVNLLAVDVLDLVRAEIGESERRVADMFSSALRLAPVLLVLDNIDTLAGMRGMDTSTHGTFDRITSTFLSAMDLCWQERDRRCGQPVVVVGIASSVSTLDPELLRGGRLEHVVHVPVPSTLDRRRICEHVLRNVHKGDDFTAGIEDIVNLTEGKTGADVVNVCLETIHASYRRNPLACVSLTKQDFSTACGMTHISS
eukprot:Rmarinus@m.24405